ncbi:MAG: hypothetical protein BWX66_01813 [Deltaproteobacteria bacterium ADurb.Bin058]|nr:MAG: hypothetical protein BWX66_01813 [Deltaproteobacteria bacterium ADurb.Bin058]
MTEEIDSPIIAIHILGAIKRLDMDKRVVKVGQRVCQWIIYSLLQFIIGLHVVLKIDLFVPEKLHCFEKLGNCGKVGLNWSPTGLDCCSLHGATPIKGKGISSPLNQRASDLWIFANIFRESFDHLVEPGLQNLVNFRSYVLLLLLKSGLLKLQHSVFVLAARKQHGNHGKPQHSGHYTPLSAKR